MKLNKISKKLLLLQRNELLSKKQIIFRKKFGRFLFTNLFVNYFQRKDLENQTMNIFEDEFLKIKNYLPIKVNTIMDIGCGLGIINILLNQHYNNEPKFYLLDKNKIDNKIKYGFSINYESYNYLENTKKILEESGIKSKNLVLKNVDNNISINDTIDLFISLKSMGYHYPFKNYLHYLKKFCNKESIFIFDIAPKHQSIKEMESYFEKINIIYEEKSIHTQIRICCTRLII